MRLLLVFVFGAFLFVSHDARAGMASYTFSGNELVIQLEGEIEQGITSIVNGDGLSLFEDPMAQGLGLNDPFVLELEDGNLDLHALQVNDGANELHAASCCILIDHEPKSRFLIDGELLDFDPFRSPFNPGPIRLESVGRQLSMRSEWDSFEPTTFYQTLYRVTGDATEYLSGVDTIVDGTTDIDIAVLDEPGEYLLTSSTAGALFDTRATIVVVPEPSSTCYLMCFLLSVTICRKKRLTTSYRSILTK